MKCLSLWNPWATAIAVGTKTIETRSWSTSYRGPLAIHAAQKYPPVAAEFAAVERALGRLPARMPSGAILVVCELVDVRPAFHIPIGPVERLYGDYSSGRFAWVLERVRPLVTPVSCIGRQGLFTIEDDLAAQVLALAIDRLAAPEDAWWRPAREGAPS